MLSYNETFNQTQFKIATNGRLAETFIRNFYEPEEKEVLVDCASFCLKIYDIEGYRPVLLDVICGDPNESIRGIVKQHFGYWEFNKIDEAVNENFQNLVTTKGIFKAYGDNREDRKLPEALIFYFPSEQISRISFKFANKNDKNICELDLYPISLEKETVFCWKESEMYSLLCRE